MVGFGQKQPPEIAMICLENIQELVNKRQKGDNPTIFR